MKQTDVSVSRCRWLASRNTASRKEEDKKISIEDFSTPCLADKLSAAEPEDENRQPQEQAAQPQAEYRDFEE
jgi:hypothetical protein